MWKMHWYEIDPSMQTEIIGALLRLTRVSQLYWTSVGEKFRVAASGGWMFAMKICEFTELPTLVAYRESCAIVLVCDRQKSRAPASTIMWGLMNLLDRQLPPHEVKSIAGEDGRNLEDRFEEDVARRLDITEGETTINALTGAILRELRGR
ncbi:MAG: hypothetical protein Q7R85_01580 [bacterium]|nr:hypothetical protein [bacterium]